MAMEKQMQAERERRAVILQSDGEKQAAVNVAEGQKQKAVLESEGLSLRQINEAEGEAAALSRLPKLLPKVSGLWRQPFGAKVAWKLFS